MPIDLDESCRSTILAVARMEDSLVFQRALLCCLAAATHDGIIDRLSYGIINALHPICRGVGLVQGAYALRFSEVAQVSLFHIIEGVGQTIQQGKVDWPRYLSPYPGYEAGIMAHLVPPRHLSIVSYDVYKREVARCIPTFVLTALDAEANKTHVFRHLRASWLRARGKTIGEISKFFVHRSEATTCEYINDVLVDYFATNK